MFVNRRRDRMKLLVWDRTGSWLFYKRLKDVLMMLEEGIDFSQIKRRHRYQKQANESNSPVISCVVSSDKGLQRRLLLKTVAPMPDSNSESDQQRVLAACLDV